MSKRFNKGLLEGGGDARIRNGRGRNEEKKR
jgi:hypothetical protein